MKKSFKLIVGIVIVISLASIIYSYFNVTGDEIAGISDITVSSNIIIRKSYVGSTTNEEYVLNADQIKMLKTLILESNFTRNLSNKVRFYDKDMYTIVINYKNSSVGFNIHCTGNEWISIASQFNGKHLKVNNLNWKSSLEEIIESSN